jgi:hypothetical protein
VKRSGYIWLAGLMGSLAAAYLLVALAWWCCSGRVVEWAVVDHGEAFELSELSYCGTSWPIGMDRVLAPGIRMLRLDRNRACDPARESSLRRCMALTQVRGVDAVFANWRYADPERGPSPWLFVRDGDGRYWKFFEHDGEWMNQGIDPTE